VRPALQSAQYGVSQLQISNDKPLWERTQIRFILLWKWSYTCVLGPRRSQEEDLLMSASLKAAFDEVLGHFNDVKYDDLMGVIDADIVLKRVLKPGSVVGIGNVEAYLVKHMAPLRPSFENLGAVTFHPPLPATQATYAHARGTGDYYDDNVNPGKRKATRVHFVWIFTRSDVNEDWSLIHVFGCPI
jgi:hypothetical protein